jgi:hypothetical protein
MKSLLICLSLVTCFSLQAKLTATEAFEGLLATGKYKGLSDHANCTVNVDINVDNVIIEIQTISSYQSFGLINNVSTYTIDEKTGNISAAQKISFPRYELGGTKSLLVRPRDNNQVEFYISEILYDHHGNDDSSFTSCTITK